MFDQLGQELDKWEGQGRVPSFWWRDDDVQTPGAELEKLLAISTRYRAPLALASIPDGVDEALAGMLAQFDRVDVLLHGFSHRNHAPAGERKMELGDHRRCHLIQAEISQGLQDFQRLFGAQFVAALVPPWNRIAPQVLDCLAASGICGLSTLGPREQAIPYPGIVQVNVHVDILNWREGRRFAGEQSCIDQLVRHLRSRRKGQVDRDEPTGIMSHHLVHDAACWAFLENLFAFLRQRDGIRIMAASEIFTGGKPS